MTGDAGFQTGCERWSSESESCVALQPPELTSCQLTYTDETKRGGCAMAGSPRTSVGAAASLRWGCAGASRVASRPSERRPLMARCVTGRGSHDPTLPLSSAHFCCETQPLPVSEGGVASPPPVPSHPTTQDPPDLKCAPTPPPPHDHHHRLTSGAIFLQAPDLAQFHRLQPPADRSL